MRGRYQLVHLRLTGFLFSPFGAVYAVLGMVAALMATVLARRA